MHSTKKKKPNWKAVWFQLHDILEKAKLETEKLNELFPRVSGMGMGLIAEGHKGPGGAKETFCIFTEMVARWLHAFAQAHQVVYLKKKTGDFYHM